MRQSATFLISLYRPFLKSDFSKIIGKKVLTSLAAKIYKNMNLLLNFRILLLKQLKAKLAFYRLIKNWSRMSTYRTDQTFLRMSQWFPVHWLVLWQMHWKGWSRQLPSRQPGKGMQRWQRSPSQPTCLEFHQRSMYSFYARRSQKRKKKLTFWLNSYTFGTYECKSCTLNVDEIDPCLGFFKISSTFYEQLLRGKFQVMSSVFFCAFKICKRKSC